MEPDIAFVAACYGANFFRTLSIILLWWVNQYPTKFSNVSEIPYVKICRFESKRAARAPAIIVELSLQDFKITARHPPYRQKRFGWENACFYALRRNLFNYLRNCNFLRFFIRDLVTPYSYAPAHECFF